MCPLKRSSYYVNAKIRTYFYFLILATLKLRDAQITNEKKYSEERINGILENLRIRLLPFIPESELVYMPKLVQVWK